ncbi:MAG: GAF domain-containing protein [Chloroflexi bacterium]|nr:GAF domain-containing protein [Chloroflexota bacterium]
MNPASRSSRRARSAAGGIAAATSAEAVPVAATSVAAARDETVAAGAPAIGLVDEDLARIVGRAIDEATGLLDADGGVAFLVDEATGVMRAAAAAGPAAGPSLRRLELAPGEGIFGRAVAADRVIVTGDYPADTSFRHGPGADAVAAELDVRSVAVAPMSVEGRPVGALGVFSSRRDAFGPPAAALVRILAEHAATAVTNHRLIEELARARVALERRAAAERTLHDIGAQVAALADPVEVLQEVVAAARGLVGADFGNIDLVEPVAGQQAWTAPARAMPASGLAGLPGLDRPERLPGLWGLAIRAGRAVATADYVHDPAFIHEPAMDENAARLGIRAGAAVPLRYEGRVLGVLQVATTQPGTFDDDALALLDALATDAAAAIASSRWIAELDESRAALAQRVDVERTLREIGAALSRLHDPAEVVQRAVDETARLLGAEGALVDVLDPDFGPLPGMYRSGRRPDDVPWAAAAGELLRIGVPGQAVARGEPAWTGDYVADDRFAHTDRADDFARAAGIRSVISAPLVGERGSFGALTAFSTSPDAFGRAEAATLSALAAQVAVGLTNARLIAELSRSREDLGRAVATERTLRQIAARVTALTDLPEVLASVVDEARRLLGSDGAHLTRVAEDGSHVYPVIVAGGMDGSTAAWLRSQRFPIEDGINGLAAGRNQLTWTEDYLADDRIPREPDDLLVASRMGLRAMAAAPLRAAGGRVIGTLAVSYGRPRAFEPDELERLQGLADHAAIALANSLLFERLAESEARYRQLVSTSPDVVWETDAEGTFTFVSDGCLALIGVPPSQVVGRSFADIVSPVSIAEARDAFDRLRRSPEEPLPARLLLRHRDGSDVPVENVAIGRLDAQGRFLGGHGSARDIRDRERLERDLRRQAADLAASEERAHLARELHDSVTQALFSMGLLIRSIELLLERDPAAAGGRLADLRDLQRDALAETRSLVFELRPGSLAEEGLEGALQTHVAGLAGRLGLPVILDLAAPGRLPPQSEETLYRIAQEALHNVVKHAGAREVRLELRRAAGEVRLAVTDDGTGFDPARVGGEHLGLDGMRARAERAGGRLEISSRPGGPTRVTVSIPAGPARE